MQAQPISIKSITFLCCLFFNTSFAQFYPVQITPQLVPPYSVYLSDYATPGNEKLRVIVLQKDLAQPAYQLRLTMSVEWNGKVIMRTAKTFNPAPINIDPGIPTIISGAELAPYLDSRNIDFVGYNREQYERTRALPEGSYRIFFTAYDYRRQDVQVSNEGSSFYYLSKNEPPLINFPACGTRIQFKDPQQIIFSWLPRNTSSPNSVAETEYEITLFETRPAGRNPNDVINTTQPIFRTRTDVTQLVFGPAESLLMEGMKYVWRVQAIDKNGRDAFRNNGFSEVCTFTYGGGDATFDIGVVKNLQAVGETERRAKISWEAINYDSYKVYYKKTGSPSGGSAQAGGYEWFWSEVTNTEFKLFDLEPDTEYETRVQVKKSGVFGPYSEIIKFRTTPIRVVECGQENGALAKGDVNKPLDAAHKGMTVDVDGIKMTLLEVMPLGAGWFKGMGTATTKLLGASFHVKFDRLFIDENHVAGFGRIDFISKGVAQLVQQQMVNLQKKEEQKQQAQNRDQWKGFDFQDKIFKYDMLIAEISFDNGAVTIIDSEGNSFPNNEIPQMLIDAPEKAIIIEDKNGDQWVMQKDENGNTKATKVPGGGLVVGQDGKMVDEKTLGGLYSKILASLRKYKKAIDEYQASIQQTQPGKGGGPSLEEAEIEMLLPELPSCLTSYKDSLKVISANITTYLDSGSRASLEFGVDVSIVLAPEFPAEADQNNAPLEKVEKAVCIALIGKLFKTFFNSRYVIVNRGLLVEAWASNKENDMFTQDIVSEVDSNLETLDKEGKKTYILIKHTWVDQNVIDALKDNKKNLEQNLAEISTKAKEDVIKELGKTDFNLLVVVNVKYDTALSSGLKSVSFRELFYPMDGMDPLCINEIRKYLNDDSKKKFVDGLNEALKERSEKLLEKLKGCKVEKPKEIVIRYKRKGRNQYRTWGEFTIDGTEYKGYILERPKGSNSTILQDYKRHPAGTYNIGYSEDSGGEAKFNNVTLYIVENPGYKLHCGNRADQSDGCLLINFNSPQLDKYPDAYQSYERDINKPTKQREENPDRLRPVANSYPEKFPDKKTGSSHDNPISAAYQLRKKVKEMEDEIKLKCKCSVVKKIVIDELEEKEDL